MAVLGPSSSQRTISRQKRRQPGEEYHVRFTVPAAHARHSAQASRWRCSSAAALAQNRTFTFAYDQPRNSGYGIGAEIFNKKLMELSKGTLSINQYPSAQLGTEPQTLQKVQTGDIDFTIVATANASTAQPESGVFSIHFIFRNEAHAIKVLGDPQVIAAMKELVRRQDDGRAHDRARLARPARHLRQEAGAEGRRPQGHEDARAGDGDGGHAVPRLWRAGRAHAVRRSLHLAADRRGRHGRERHQQLPGQQAL